ncbi:DNA polymerase III subunit epsilon [Neoehrlichia mikurensis]|uniref:DNA polymerase III subunit epsilon n=1 Tax=Neoehrlichia mikurensis TaxID=89586 RepID=A0A9Q9F3I7_9RICK|nr:DNA polymerase III subunit epsilon [Neoehrlichia mikurensis]QXK91922.1 DNA polymerase III subunit epsilon [Neoehrlichia mikurensis]QXK93135.1 DNA polymerase III subunit epsilon [Neoehrlichia mikurensis]QXK93615.1 DNA polymerase III subunit epsilon [Neoehrlichia mikurensis]UTO55429.1 DNA polymerase III subunit epsilon [Neoehrlichia mikurensis]UTO56349.1 DNA polymerase III subunit epsilon [Neoehrlichia mikurensis]
MRVREIVLDTETTGLDANGGDRIVEIGCVELVDYIFTGNVFHHYINPERDIPYYSTKIHGITVDMVKDKPKFADIADKFLDFISDGILVIHNAKFDISFIEMELSKINKEHRLNNSFVDTLILARKKFPGMPVTLDALCKRFNISLQDRKFHGALLDATLLSKVYIELKGGLQRSLNFSDMDKNNIEQRFTGSHNLCMRHFKINQYDYEKHKELLKKIKNSIWNKLK